MSCTVVPFLPVGRQLIVISSRQADVTKRYRDDVTVVMGEDDGAPAAFTWRDTTYRVVGVLGHWREDARYWSGGGVEIPQRELWRVEARNGIPRMGIYELVREAARWRLDRVWD